MLVLTLIKGIGVGIVIALPVGPVGLLCVRRTLFEGASYGLASGLGATLADTCFGVIAGFGLTVVRDSILALEGWLGAAGGAFLLYAGAAALLGRAAPAFEPVAGERIAGAFASAFALTITNPITLIAFAAIFAKVGLAEGAAAPAIAVLVAGVVLGSSLWWVGLTVAVAWLRRGARQVTLAWLNRLCGLILVGAGAGLVAVSLADLAAHS